MTQYYIDERPEKKRRTPVRNFVLVVLIASAIFFAGELAAVFSINLSSRYIYDGGWRFLLDNYLPFLGPLILMIIYLAVFDKELFRTTLSASRGGLKNNTLKWILLGLLAGFVLNGFCALIAFLHGDLDFSFGQFDPVYMIAALIIVGIQSSTEELVLRGYVFQAVCRRYGLIAGVVCNSVYFTLAHLANPGIGPLPILLLLAWSVLTSLVLYYYDSLWFIMMAHTTWNYTQNFLLGLPNSGIVSERSLLHLDMASGSIFYDTGFGLEGGITALIIYILLSAAIVISSKNKKSSKDDL